MTANIFCHKISELTNFGSHKYLLSHFLALFCPHPTPPSQASLARDRAVGVAARRAHIAELKECDQLLTVVQCMFTGLRRTSMGFDQVCARATVYVR